MFNKEFLQTLTVLYVEDDESIRTSLSNILKKVFAEVIICDDGDNGIEQFKHYTQEKKSKIDLVISDINMPNKNGIEMVKEIRELDKDIPIIFTTAHGESDYLMESIKLKIAHYALKPINTSNLLDNISNFCMIEKNKTLLEEKSKQITQYMDIINGITAIFKVDLQGNIIEVNDLLCELSQYTHDELIGMHIDNILHKDTILKTFNDTLALIDSNDSFNGKLKFSSKLGNTFYMNSTIITLKNEYSSNIEGYIYICLDQTDDEIEKQQTMQRVRKNMIQQRTKESVLLKNAKELEEEIEKIKASSISSKDTKVILSSLAKEKQKVITLNTQITHYEEQIVKLTQQKQKIDTEEKIKKLETMKKAQDYINEKEKFQSKIIDLQALVSKQEAKLKEKSVH
ncbi:response regulator [Arcobacteraceae bacterium]|nr:response regulator [Arcobacteraceae bacterium]